MAFNINEMLGTISDVNGLTRSAKFFCEIYPPSNVGIDRSIYFLCENAMLPGLGLQTEEVKMFGYGTAEKRPYGIAFNDVPVTFLSDANGKVFKFFHKWLQSIYNFNGSTNPNATSTSGLPSGSFEYPNSYYGTVQISHFDEASNEVITFKLNEAYPISVGDIQVDWGMSDQIMRIPVSFAYTYWDAQTIDPGVVTPNSESNYNSDPYTTSRIDSPLSIARELQSYTSPLARQSRLNSYAGFLTFR